MIICGGVWIADFHNFRLHGTVFHEFKHINSAHGIWSGVLVSVYNKEDLKVCLTTARQNLIFSYVGICYVGRLAVGVSAP